MCASFLSFCHAIQDNGPISIDKGQISFITGQFPCTTIRREIHLSLPGDVSPKYPRIQLRFFPSICKTAVSKHGLLLLTSILGLFIMYKTGALPHNQRKAIPKRAPFMENIRRGMI